MAWGEMAQRAGAAPSRRVLVEGLPRNVTEDALRTALSHHVGPHDCLEVQNKNKIARRDLTPLVHEGRASPALALSGRPM